MECLICHKDFSALGSHLRTHQISPRDYRLEFNIPLLEPLIEKWLSESKSQTSKKLAQTEEGKDRLKRGRLKAATINRGAKRKRIAPECSLTRMRNGLKKGRDKSAIARKQRAEKRILGNEDLMRDFYDGVSLRKLSIRYSDLSSSLRNKLVGKRVGGHHYPISIKLKIIKSRNDGLTWKEIRKKYGVSSASVYRWKRQFKDMAA